MNPTIVKIIDLMFRGMPEREEISAMREELLTNSQARYDDLIASGKSSNEALGEVLDSLRGVEELLDEYRTQNDQQHRQNDGFAFARFERMAEEIDRRFSTCADTVKTAAGNATTAAEKAFGTAMDSVRTAVDSFASGLRGHEDTAGSTPANGLWSRSNVYGGGELLTASVSPARCSRVKVELAGDDVELRPSQDGLIHVEIDPQDEALLVLEILDGCLVLRRAPDAPEPAPEEVEMEGGFFGFLNGLGKAIRNTVRNLRACCGLIRVLVPGGLDAAEVYTASGDILVEEVRLGKLNVTTASGDITVDDTSAADMELCNTSGDTALNTVTVAGHLSLNATSGDFDLLGVSAPAISTNNVSGDTEIDAVLKTLDCNTVSGDIDITANRTGVESITANTTSGDIDVSLPDVQTAAVYANTTCGDIDIDKPTNPASGCVLRLNTVSGDISVSNF